MEKRYQVFISSTYADLEEERLEVMQALLELDAIPAGMELFPAANEDQWSLIKKVIDDSDYYVVIVAGRYGSIGPEGISYTEMEYRYALDIGKPIIGFIHKAPDLLPAKRCESTDEGKKKLQEFVELVKGKPCQMWESPSDLGGKVSRSLVKLIKSNPAIGWIRGNTAASSDLLVEINELRKKNELLENKVKALEIQNSPNISDIVSLDAEISFRYLEIMHDTPRINGRECFQDATVTLKDVFKLISPSLIQTITTYTLKQNLNSQLRDHWVRTRILHDQYGRKFSMKIDNIDFETLLVHFKALNLIAVQELTLHNGGTNVFCKLTKLGEKMMLELKAIKKTDSE